MMCAQIHPVRAGKDKRPCSSSTRGWPGKLLKMSYMKTKTKTKSKKEIVLDGDNPQDYAQWSPEVKILIKAKLGAGTFSRTTRVHAQ